jgi:small subunit ribosomal protein S16
VSVKIRLQRKGTTNVAFFRIVVADSRAPRDGRFVDQLGYYDPRKNPADIKVDTTRVIDWLGKGAQPSETVKSLLARVGIMQTWHEMKKGKSLDDLRHIEDEARQRMAVEAAMQHGKRQAAKEKKAAAKEEPPVAREEPPAVREEPPAVVAAQEEAPAAEAAPEAAAEAAPEPGADEAKGE